MVVMLRHLNLTIHPDGHVTTAPPSMPHGYSRALPIVRVVGIPPSVADDDVIDAYSKCVVLPVMHADIPVPWHRIADADQGDIIRLKAGRPAISEDRKSVRINITLSPAAIAALDARGNGRSQEIERLIQKSIETSDW